MSALPLIELLRGRDGRDGLPGRNGVGASLPCRPTFESRLMFLSVDLAMASAHIEPGLVASNVQWQGTQQNLARGQMTCRDLPAVKV